MKKIAALIITLVFCTAIVDFVKAEEIIFEMDDPEGDDYGPGTYEYPEFEGFVLGVFDLLHFEVSKDAEHAVFKFTYKNLGGNPWKGPSGFSFQFILVCIDTDRVLGSGNIETLMNVGVHPANAWEYMLAVGGAFTVFTNTIYLVDMSLYPPQGKTGGGVMDISVDGNTIIAKVPIDIIGEPNENWAYTVLAWSEDMGHSRYVLPTEQVKRVYDAGGADPDAFEAGVSPQVFDILVPPGVTQEDVLTNYSIVKQRLAWAYAVGPGIEGPPPAVQMPVLRIETTPISAEVFVNEESWGTTPVEREVLPGEYTVSFADMEGYTSPSSKTVTLTWEESETVAGTYTAVAAPTKPFLTIVTVAVVIIALIGAGLLVWRKRG